MIRHTVVALGLMVAGALVAALTIPSAPARADSFAFGYSSGHYPRHYHHRHHHHHGPRARVVYVAPPPVYYYPPRPPRVVYVTPPPPPVYTAPAPVTYQTLPGQTLPGGRLTDTSQCREYQSTAVVNGQQVASYGTACLQPDGSWRIVR